MVQPLKSLSEVEQAVYFHSRERVRSLRDVSQGLFRTTVLPLNLGDFAAARFGSRTRPVTVVQWLEITGASPAGVVWEIGSDAVGAGLAFDSGDLIAAAGSDTGDDGVEVSLSGIDEGERIQVAVAINPGTRRIGIYVNGHLEARANGVDPFPSGAYSDAGGGRVNGVNGTANPRLASTASLSDVAIVSPVSVFVGQLPRGFEA